MSCNRPIPFSPCRPGISALLAITMAIGASSALGVLPDLRPDSAAAAGAGLHSRYGAAVALGDGQARTYIVEDERSGTPIEVGVALSAAALEGLPKQAPDHGPGTHGPYSEYLLELPADNPTPYRFVELDWNPHGHGGPYTAPHFDFHFYRVPLATRNEIDLRDPEFASKAARLPAPDEMPARYASTHVLLNTTPAGMTVPRMGLHWIDSASPELPPSNKPFTGTFIIGSWNGQVIFDEPMVTRDYILAQRTGPATADSTPLPIARRYAPAGYYPVSYGIKWDEDKQEYRIALQGLTFRN
jgi:hypothetical protein